MTKLALLITIAAVFTTGCFVRGKEEGEAAAAIVAPAPSPEEMDDWTAGRLPDGLLEGEPRRGGQLVLRMTVDPPSLNSLVDSDWWGSRIAERVYEPLLEMDPYDDPDYAYRPVLAESWEESESGTVFTFHLRRDVRWHDGEPFTSRDVVATFEKVRDPETRCVHVRAYMLELESVEALDDYTVRFTWKQPYALAMSTMALEIQPAHIIEPLSPSDYNEARTNPLQRRPLGTGPWRFVEWASNSRIVLERNDDYWGRPPYLDRLVFRIVPDDTVALQLTERGEVDLLTGIPSERWVSMDSEYIRQNYNRSAHHDSNYTWIGWNQRSPLFGDPRVRKALTLMIDRPSIIEHILYGLPVPATCHFYWRSEACDPEIESLPFDPEAGLELMAEAGWEDTTGDGWLNDEEGRPFRFTLMLPGGRATTTRLATKMREDFRRAGVDMLIQMVEWAGFTRRLREGEFDACTLAWSGGHPHGGDPTQIWHSSSIEGGSNYIGYSNPRVDRLIERARVEMDQEARNEMWRRFSRLIYAEQPYTWLWTSPRLTLINKRFRGVRESLMWWQFKDWWVADESLPPANEEAGSDAG
ncbi:MAG: peptide-binding protein [Myxococcota bacterium]